jgi:hypothetical protein
MQFLQDKYLEYFEWKTKFIMLKQEPYCQLCEKLHNENEPGKIYPNMTDWFYYDRNGKLLCKDGSDREYYSSMFFK